MSCPICGRWNGQHPSWCPSAWRGAATWASIALVMVLGLLALGGCATVDHSEAQQREDVRRWQA